MRTLKWQTKLKNAFAELDGLSAKGAAVIVSLGQRPRFNKETLSAESAIHAAAGAKAA